MRRTKKFLLSFFVSVLFLVVLGSFWKINYVEYKKLPSVDHIHGSTLYKPKVNIFLYGPLAKKYVEQEKRFLYECGHPGPCRAETERLTIINWNWMTNFVPTTVRIHLGKFFKFANYAAIKDYGLDYYPAVLSFYWRSLLYWFFLSLVISLIIINLNININKGQDK